MSADWYAKKLGNPRPGPRESTPPYTPSVPQRIAEVPTHSRSQQQPEVKVTAENLAEAAALWKGGQGTKTEQQTCPHCNSDLYFSRANGTAETGGSGARVFTNHGMATVAPRCFSCGFSSALPMQTGSM